MATSTPDQIFSQAMAHLCEVPLVTTAVVSNRVGIGTWVRLYLIPYEKAGDEALTPEAASRPAHR